MKQLLNITAELYWLSVAILFWGLETIASLFFDRSIFIKNLREFPGFLFNLVRDGL